MEESTSGSFDITSTLNENEDDESHLSWKERYELVEQQLSKFRTQAGKVRELLSQKVIYQCFGSEEQGL